MAAKKKRGRGSRGRGGAYGNDVPGGAETGEEPEFTGNYLVVLQDGEEAVAATAHLLRDKVGVQSVARAAGGDTDVFDAMEEDAVILADLGVAVVTLDPDAAMVLESSVAEASTPLQHFERERFVRALGPEHSYMHGFRDAADFLLHAFDVGLPTSASADPTSHVLGSRATWGLRATGAINSSFTGMGTRVAVLDTGVDQKHPDLRNRILRTASFVPQESVQDGYGHGTHCIGTACGPLRPGVGRRYGVATSADILAGKVLSNLGRGRDAWILAGIQWAVQEKATVISLSLGSIGPVSPTYTAVGRRAMESGALIVAAAGNGSHRPLHPRPVTRPANSPSILAVGAIDRHMGVAAFSNQGDVAIAAPGVDVYSSWPLPRRTRTISGTSMATPHVAGLAALWREANPAASPRELWLGLTAAATRLPLPARDVGAGLAQAP